VKINVNGCHLTPFHNRNLERFEYINLKKIVYLIQHGRLNPEKVITIKDLKEAGAFRRVKYGVKILGRVF